MIESAKAAVSWAKGNWLAAFFMLLSGESVPYWNIRRYQSGSEFS